MTVGERIKLAAQKKEEYLANAGKYQDIKKKIKIIFFITLFADAVLIFFSVFTFFFETLTKDGKPGVNIGIIQLLAGIFLLVLNVVVASLKHKNLLFLSLVPIVPSLAFALFGNTELRASIRNFWGIPVESYLDIKGFIIVFCLLLLVLKYLMYTALCEHDEISKCEGFPHFQLRCNKLEDYMPDEYTAPEERKDTPDTLYSGDMQKYTAIENSQAERTYTPGVMDTIDPALYENDDE